jgi:pSer/pThr/pTyr-binding forkhead associated (FHA) protein
VPEPSPQELTPIDVPAPVPYAGPHLVLNSTGSIFKLGDAAVIGREDPALQIDFEGYPDGQYISHRHAQIVKMNETYYIEDLGSSNGTWVNNIRLAQGQSEPLEADDKIRMGKIELTFHAS